MNNFGDGISDGVPSVEEPQWETAATTNRRYGKRPLVNVAVWRCIHTNPLVTAYSHHVLL